MADEDRFVDRERFECAMDEHRLRLRRARVLAAALAVSVAWAIEGNDQVVLRQLGDDAAPIVDRARVAVKKNDRLSASFADVVKADAVYRRECTAGRILRLRVD